MKSAAAARSTDAWISVQIRPGLFPSERTVQFRAADGEEIAVFVSLSQIDEGKQTLRVTLLDENKEFALVQVPSQGGTTVVKVPRRDIHRN
jgi:hypothetical protein